ncbi:TrmH family RNA methyltransferase [Patescibacteria group bacterium]|nr:MAG: TrmH family RNA methyltransferase [Patescibacteria group bacterium]
MREIVLILQNIRSLHNVGSIFRTADVFGVSKIYLCGYTGAPPRREIAKVALGAEDAVPWEKIFWTDTAVKKLRRDGYQIVALETGRGSIPINQARLAKRLALVLGNEVRGVTPAILRRADQTVGIPLLGKKESLNVSVAAGAALYALRYGHRP